MSLPLTMRVPEPRQDKWHCYCGWMDPVYRQYGHRALYTDPGRTYRVVSSYELRVMAHKFLWEHNL